MTAAAKRVFQVSIPVQRCKMKSAVVVLTLSAAVSIAAHSPADAATPNIRTSQNNVVPACVTPPRLMAFLKQRNHNLEPRFGAIADWYKRHGESWHVRWDYAFFQMAVETNFLTFKRGDGSWGDAKPKQNNFAGLGTTGGGVPGDSFPDVGTGVLAQIQHLVVYSGEHIASPVGPRTRLKQDDIIEATGSKKGRMTFADLARRWAADKHYGAAIEWVAGSYRKAYCNGASDATLQAKAATQRLPRAAALGGPAVKKTAPVRTIWSRDMQPAAPVKQVPPELPTKASDVIAREAPKEPAAPPTPPAPPAVTPPTPPVETPAQVEIADAETEPAAPSATVTAEPASEPENVRAFAFAGRMRIGAGDAAVQQPQAMASADTCSVVAASYGGEKTLLVRGTGSSGEVRYTILTVLAGFEHSMLDSYIKAHAPGGASLGEFESRDAALARARQLCPNAAGMTQTSATRAG